MPDATTAISAADLDRLRRDTPGCAERAHLNNAGAGLMPTPVIEAIRDHLDLEARIGGYEAAEAREAEIAAAYDAIGRLVGAPVSSIAMTEHATASYVAALSAIEFQPGDAILTTRNDYASNQIQFLSLARRFGVRIETAPDDPEGGVDVDAMADRIDSLKPKLVSVTHVPTSSGLVQDVAAIGAACRARNVWYLVDACQSVGQMPIDVNAIGCDFLSVTSRKFLRGPRGAGFLYVSPRALDAGLEPLFLDMRGGDWTEPEHYLPRPDAKRFETWETAWALALATGAAAEYALAIGLEPIRDRARALAERLRDGLRSIIGVRLLDPGAELCAIVTMWMEGKTPRELQLTLRARGINASIQDQHSGVLHYADQQTPGSLRLSPHYYNLEAEIDRAVAVIAELASPS